MRHESAPASRSPGPGESLRGRTLTCGPATHRRLARLLGLDRGPESYEISSALWVSDHVEIELVAITDRSRISLVLEETRPERAFVAGPRVCLWVRDSSVPPQLARRLQAVTRPLLVRLALSDLERMVVLDPDAAPAVPTRPGRDNPSPQPPLEGISLPTTAVRAHTAPELYADFFAASEIRRAGCDLIDVHSAHTLVTHGDVECSYCAVCVPSPRVGLVRLPVYETVRNLGKPPAQHGAFNESEDPSGAFCSDMTEEDVIMGSPSRMSEVLRHADLHRSRDSLLVVGLCLPDVIGEDQESAVREFAQTTTTPVFSVPAAPRSWAWLAKDLLRTRRQALPQTDADREREPSVNLIGFARNAGSDDLVGLLAAAGISVSTFLLPELAMDAVARIPRAAVNVYLPNVHWEKTYSHLQDDPGRRHRMLDGPFGMQGTRRWVEEVCAELAVECDVSGILSERVAGLAPRWEALRAQAAECRLGLVVPGHEIETLLDARHSWGIPLTRVLREMGFGLDLFVGSEAGARLFRSRTTLSETEYTLHAFDSLPDLLETLQRSPCQAVFSNYVFDWRLVCAGKAPFSTLEFEYGLRGAIATLERLLAVCRLPLFRAGRRFIAPVVGRGGANAV